ncbi:IPTL-CTERM sorting domain-containing protein [Brevundimonas naejangsanensis]|uniref:IPTL-CTERM sorting domain-containing protein n=1 Tax=Brevundimonas naejangsanensis TaxID=588932 RepID=UPI003D06E484
MKQLIGYAVAALGLIASQAVAAPVTYYVQSEPYTAITNSTACPVGVCKAYGAGQRLSGTITFFGPLDPDLDVHTDDVGHMIDDFQLSDGQNTYTLLNAGVPDPNMVINFANVSTDASGVVTAFEFKFDRTNGAPYSVSVMPSNDLQTRVSTIYFTSIHPAVSVDNNARCTARGTVSNAPTNTPGAGCIQTTVIPAEGASQAQAGTVTMSLTPPAPPAPVPTLSEWAMILLGVLLAGGAALHLQRRRQTA